MARPVPGPGEVLLRMRAALTCGTDIKTLVRGHPRIRLPLTMGHEVSGEVVEVGEGVVRWNAGDRVVPGISGPCGRCADCRGGRSNLCGAGHADRMWGAFAEFVRVPAGGRLVEPSPRPRGSRRRSRGVPGSAGFRAPRLEPAAGAVGDTARLRRGRPRLPVGGRRASARPGGRHRGPAARTGRARRALRGAFRRPDAAGSRVTRRGERRPGRHRGRLHGRAVGLGAPAARSCVREGRSSSSAAARPARPWPSTRRAFTTRKSR